MFEWDKVALLYTKDDVGYCDAVATDVEVSEGISREKRRYREAELSEGHSDGHQRPRYVRDDSRVQGSPGRGSERHVLCEAEECEGELEE